VAHNSQLINHLHKYIYMSGNKNKSNKWKCKECKQRNKKKIQTSLLLYWLIGGQSRTEKSINRSSKACGQDQTPEQIDVCQAIKIKNKKRKYIECKEIKENYRDISFAFFWLRRPI
jgi:hypothetical protein